MDKKVIVFAILALAVLSLSSCKSKNSCTKVNNQTEIQQTQQNVDVACIEVE